MNVSVYVPQWSYEELYGLFMKMPMEDLMNEYIVAMACADCYYGVSESLVYSGLLEYINAWLDIMRFVIAERMCDCDLYRI